MHRNLTPEEQGYRWQAAGGSLHDCWYKEGSVERRQWERGWRRSEEEQASLLREIAVRHKNDL